MSSRALRPYASGFGFLEAPRWHKGSLWCVDYLSHSVLRLGGRGEAEVVAKVAAVPGGIGFLPDGTPLVVSQRDFKILAVRSDGSLAIHADLTPHARGAANELLVDAQGRAYVGHHGFDFFAGALPQLSSLLLVTQQGKVEVVADGLTFPNGMALTPDARTLIVAESFANRLTAFDVQGDGSLGAPRQLAALGEHTPDGLCLDEEGSVWTGSPMTGQFVCVSADGTIKETLSVAPGRWAVACVFGGADRRTLFCLTAATSLEDMPKGRSNAFIEAVDLDIGGAGNP